MVSTDDSAIVLSKDKAKTHDFFLLDLKLLRNENMEHLIYFKYFEFKLHPVILRIDGSFLEKLYRFYKDSFQPLMISLNKKKK